MNNEKWQIWTPAGITQSNYFIESVCNNRYGLKIVLIDIDDNQNELHISFEYRTYCYRETPELYSDKRIQNLIKEYEVNFFPHTNFFKIINSDYIQWASEQSGGLSDYKPYEHFVIYTEDWMVEVLSNYEPKIEFIKL